MMCLKIPIKIFYSLENYCNVAILLYNVYTNNDLFNKIFYKCRKDLLVDWTSLINFYY